MVSDRSSRAIEGAEAVVKTPSEELARLRLRHPIDYVNRLDSISDPKSRLKIFLNSCISLEFDHTHEAKFVKHVTFVSMCGSFILGAIFNTGQERERFIRENNASFFENRFLGHRAYYSNMALAMVHKGSLMAIKSGLTLSASAFLYTASTVYRGDAYLPDILVGYTIIGGLTRAWLGPRGWAVGGLFGAIAGLGLYGTIRGLEVLTGMPMSKRKLLNHQEWIDRQETRRRALMNCQDHYNKELLEKAMSGDGTIN